MFNITNQLLTHQSFLCQSARLINEPGYAFTISQHCKFKFLTESDIQDFMEAEENQKTKKQKLLGFGYDISCS